VSWLLPRFIFGRKGKGAGLICQFENDSFSGWGKIEKIRFQTLISFPFPAPNSRQSYFPAFH
jgi:hypothetical protein